MALSSIASLGSIDVESTAQSTSQTSSQANFVSDFAKIIRNNIGETNGLLNKADQISTDFSVNKTADLHEVMIAVEEAGMALNYTMQVRNKVVEGYQELMRMQI